MFDEGKDDEAVWPKLGDTRTVDKVANSTAQQEDNYRPWRMRPRALICFGTVPLLIFGITEYLFQTSQKHIHLFRDDAGEVRYVFRETVAQFFGLLVVVLVGMYFYDLDMDVKTMEPYYQLTKPGGELGAHSLCVDYFRISVYLSPITAIFTHRHWAVACSATANAIATNGLPTLALGIFGNDDVDPMHPIYTRGFETGCLVLSILSFTLLAIVMRRKTGVDAYPNRFLTLMRYTKRRDRPDSIFSLITAQQFADGTQGDPVQSLGLHGDKLSEERVDTIFRGRRFALKRPSGCGPNESLELLVVPNEDSDLDTSHWYDWITSCLPKFPWWPHFRDTHLWIGSHPVLFQSLPLGIVSFCLVGLFVVAAGQPWWAQDTAFFTFVGDNRFARSTVSTVINTLIWGQIERNAKMMQPIYQLLEDGGMRLNDLELDYMELGIFLDLWFAFRSRLNGPGTKRRSSEKAFICIMIGSYAAELFTVFWNVIALSSYYISLPIWSCLVATEGCMLLSLVILWLQRRRPVVPRQPVTLASNLLYVYASDICEEHFLPSWQSPNSCISDQNDGVDHAMLSPPRSATSDLQQMRDNTVTSAYPSGLLKPASRMASRRPSEALSVNTRPSSGAVTLVGSSTTLDPATSDIRDSTNPGSSDIEMIHPAPVGPEDPRLGKIKSLDPGMESISSDAGGDSITHSSEAAKIEIAGNPQPRKPATRRWSLVWPTMGRSRRQDCKSKITAVETVSRAQEQARCRFGEFKVGDTWHVGIALYDSVVRPYQLRDRADLEQ